MIGDGVRFIPAAIHLVLVPGLMLVLAVLAVNVFGDGARDALDPRGEIKGVSRVRRPWTSERARRRGGDPSASADAGADGSAT
jgi:hypothetical protein